MRPADNQAQGTTAAQANQTGPGSGGETLAQLRRLGRRAAAPRPASQKLTFGARFFRELALRGAARNLKPPRRRQAARIKQLLGDL